MRNKNKIKKERGSGAKRKTKSEIGKPMKKSIRKREILISKDMVAHLITEYLRQVKEISESEELISMHLGYPGGGNFIMLTNSAEKTINLEYNVIKPNSVVVREERRVKVIKING